MIKPKLSICIATYNRAKYIGETLSSIIPQLTDAVEIIIVDGASTDNTKDIVMSFTANCKQLNYVQLPEKGGVDQDFCKAVEYAKGEYCWLFSDDDLFHPNAVATVLGEIAKNIYSLIIVNAQAMDENLSKVIENKRLSLDENKIYPPSENDKFFERTASYMSFIGCIVINRDLWMSREKESFFGTEFIHIGIIFQKTLPGSTLIIAEPLITIRVGNFQWTPRSFEIWMYKWPNLLFSFENISIKLRKKYTIAPSWSRFRSVIMHRARGTYSLKEFKQWFSSKEQPFWWRAATFSTALMPSCFLNILMVTYFQLFRKNDPVALYMLKISNGNILRTLNTF